MIVTFKGPARHELYEAYDWYEAVGQGTGDRFIEAVQHAIARICQFPESGTPGPNRARRTQLRSFPYAIWYRSDPASITIYAIAHMRRRPMYWQDRLGDREE